MSAFENATKFFHACETLKGWEGCKEYVVPGATFEAQSEPLVEVKTVEAYCDWMAGLGKGPLKGCTYQLHASSYDEKSRTATFVATFTATHVGDGGPVAPTGKETNTDYVYALAMDSNGKVKSMRKVWNAPWALKELGWMQSRHCGSSLYFWSPKGDPEVIEVALGVFDGVVPAAPDAHIYVGSTASWTAISDGLHKYVERRGSEEIEE